MVEHLTADHEVSNSNLDAPLIGDVSVNSVASTEVDVAAVKDLLFMTEPDVIS